MTIFYDAPQGSDEWKKARAGVITASMFGLVRKKVNGLTEQQQTYVDAIRNGLPDKEAMSVAGYKAAPRAEKIAAAIRGEPVGDWSDMALNYAFRVAIERISGEPLDEGFETWAMRRGHELEPEARANHAFIRDLEIESCGFAATDDRLFGASLDGIIGNDGASEYKCLVSPERLRKVIVDGDLREFVDQVQGGLWITGRKWMHFVVYCPALASCGRDLIIHEIERDDDYIEAMEQDLLAFERIVSEYERTLRAVKQAA